MDALAAARQPECTEPEPDIAARYCCYVAVVVIMTSDEKELANLHVFFAWTLSSPPASQALPETCRLQWVPLGGPAEAGSQTPLGYGPPTWATLKCSGSAVTASHCVSAEPFTVLRGPGRDA